MNPERRAILERMAEAEDRHAERWAHKLRSLGADPGVYRESVIDRIRRAVLLRSDTAAAAGILEAGESEADRLYESLMTSAPTDADRGDLTAAAR